MILAFSTMIFALNFGLFNEFDEHLIVEAHSVAFFASQASHIWNCW